MPYKPAEEQFLNDGNRSGLTLPCSVLPIDKELYATGTLCPTRMLRLPKSVKVYANKYRMWQMVQLQAVGNAAFYASNSRRSLFIPLNSLDFCGM